MGKDIKPLLERVKNADWRGKINVLMDKLRPGALKARRVAARPLVQFYCVQYHLRVLQDKRRNRGY